MSQAIFVHIPKTAGSTLRTLISENYDLDVVLDLKDHHPKELLVVSASHMGKTDKYEIIMGHMPYGVHRFLNIRNPRYFTFLRDPISRFISDVANNMRHKNNIFYERLVTPSPAHGDAFGVALDIPYYRNTMTHFVCGSYSTETISMTQLGVAIDNLWGSEFVGITEDFEVSSLILAKKLGWKRIIPQKCQVRPDSVEPVSQELKERLDRALAYDRMLYTVAQEHLARSKKMYGVLLEEAACELSEIMRIQEVEYPNAKFISKWGVTDVPLNSYNAYIKPGSPLYRWINE